MRSTDLFSSVTRIAAAAFMAVGVAACDSPTDPPVVDPGATLTVDASSATDWALVDLGSPAQVLGSTDPAGSTEWDLGFRTTNVTVNGGASGPAGMMAYCLCQNADATAEEIMAMTPQTEAEHFDAVTADQIPAAGAGWSATTFADSRWYRYNLAGGHQVWPTYDVYLVKRGSEVYKLQLTGYYGADGSPRQITFRYAKLTD